jgi:signal transduction histidine kinase
MSYPRLSVINLQQTRGNLHILHNISFTLSAGEIVGVVGRPGSGKTTLLETLGGVLGATPPAILIDGKAAQFGTPLQARRSGIELIHQTPQLVSPLGVVENIFLGRELKRGAIFGIPDMDAMITRTKEMLGAFGLSSNVINEPVQDMTDAQRHLIAVSRAFAHPQRLLLIDDMLATLSFQRQEILLGWIRRAAENGAGVLICSDNLKHLFALTDRLIVLNHGRIVSDRKTANCTPREIVEKIVGTGNREQTTPIIWALENYHKAQQRTDELIQMQSSLAKTLEASDTLNRTLVERLSEQVSAMDLLNGALQETQRRLLTEREEERKALARELHDSVIQDLLSMNYRLENTGSALLSSEQQDELLDVQESIRQVVDDIRRVCRNLRPPTIDNHGLLSALRSFVQEWEIRSGILVSMKIPPDMGRMPEATELSVFRIVQEALNNVSKHSDAQAVHLDLRRTPMDNLLIEIVDDGQGLAVPLNLAELSEQKHFGLVGISERAALLGGTMDIKTSEKGGFVVRVEIPSPYPST